MSLSVAEPITHSGAWTREQLEALAIELLADLLTEDPNELRRRLEEQGDHMPVDSLDTLDILKEFRQRTGLRIPVRKLRNRTMRSVSAFAAFVAEECQ